MKKLIIFLSCLLILGSLASCGVIDPMQNEETFEVDGFSDGIFSITLNGNFTEKEGLALLGGCSALYDSSRAKVMIQKKDAEDYELNPGDIGYLTRSPAAMEYAKSMVDILNIPYEPAYDEENGMASYRYDSSLFGVDFSGIVYIFQFNDALWVVDMACRPDDFDDMQVYFEEWALSVTIDLYDS